MTNRALTSSATAVSLFESERLCCIVCHVESRKKLLCLRRSLLLIFDCLFASPARFLSALCLRHCRAGPIADTRNGRHVVVIDARLADLVLDSIEVTSLEHRHFDIVLTNRSWILHVPRPALPGFCAAHGWPSSLLRTDAHKACIARSNLSGASPMRFNSRL